MAFEGAYAAGKAPELPINMLQAYSFLPMWVEATVDKVCAAISGLPILNRIMESLPLSIATIGLRTKGADAMVEEKDFDKEAFTRMPEGHFKYLVRKAWFLKKGSPIDNFPIAAVVKGLAAENPALFSCGLTDVSWLSDELYVRNKNNPIREIRLGLNFLTQLPEHFLDNCTQLKEINLDGNKLPQLPEHFLDNCTQLQCVLLGHNHLTQLPENFLDNCTQLQKVWLRLNKLTQLPDHFLDNCTQLKEIDLERNKLTQLPDHFLDNCTQLKEIDLERNKLTQLPENFLNHCTKLIKVRLSHNPWTTQRPDALVKALRARTPPVEVLY